MPEAARQSADTTESSEPGRVAIIGMAIRVPGAERDLDRFWSNIEQGAPATQFFERQNLLDMGVRASLVDRPNFVPARAVIRDADCFDGQLFGYSPQDSALMDPQQRVLLECSWTALEHAGYSPTAPEGNRVGVFVGTGLNVYLLDNLWPNEQVFKSAGDLQVMISSDRDFAATRIGYKLNFQGPAVTLQTACSTSLVAIHFAVQSLLTYEADLALAGAASILPASRRGYLHEPGGILSPDGRCRVFDRKAEGTVPGDGAGIVVLKRFEDAVRDRDTIHAVIAGSAVNNDGSRKAGFTAPGSAGQAEVISAALGIAGFDPDTIGFVEAHGTGTALGDPIEVAALRQVFGPARADRAPCALGAVKSITGHLDTAAGVTGVIKTALALKNRTIPPVAHFTEPNPALKMEDSVFRVPAVAEQWTPINGVRRAGVSSFGIGGTNAHLVLEEAPPPPPPPAGRPRQAPELILISAKTSSAAAEGLARAREHIAAAGERDYADIAFTLRSGRAELPWRAAFVAGPAGLTAARQPVQATSRARSRGVVFAVTGDGELAVNQASYDEDPVYHHIMSTGAARLQAITADTGEAGRERAERFLAATALIRSLQSHGLRPTAAVGRGVGAVSAACAAGAVTIADGLDLATGTARSAFVAASEPGYAVFVVPGGASLTGQQARDPGYWKAVLEDPADGWVTDQVAGLDPAACIEIGTSATLRIPSTAATSVLADPYAQLLHTVGVLWEMGICGPRDEVHDTGRRHVPAPTYPFAATRHYVEAPAPATLERQS